MSDPSGFTKKLNLLNTATFTNLIISPLASSLISAFQGIAVEIDRICAQSSAQSCSLSTPQPQACFGIENHMGYYSSCFATYTAVGRDVVLP